MFSTRTAAAVAGVGLALSMSACSSSESTADANAAYCQAQAAVQAEIANLKSLITGGGATIDQIQEQRDAVASAVDEAESQAGSLAESVQDEIKTADSTFDDSISNISGDATVSGAVSEYIAAIQAWDDSIAAIRTDVGCS